MMTVEEIHGNLLRALAMVADQHATVLGNPIPGHEPILRDIELKRLGAQVTTAKIMCRAAGIDEETVRTFVDVHYPAGRP